MINTAQILSNSYGYINTEKKSFSCGIRSTLKTCFSIATRDQYYLVLF